MAVTYYEISKLMYNHEWPGHARLVVFRDPNVVSTWKISTGAGTNRVLTGAEATEYAALLDTRRAEAETIASTAGLHVRQKELLALEDRLVQALDILGDVAAATSTRMTTLGQPFSAALNNRITALRNALNTIKAG